MRAARADRNQPAITRLFRQLGATVQHLHTVGQGCPDLLIGYQGLNGLVEIKDPEQPPSKRKLTGDEEKWHKHWNGQVEIIETQEDVVIFLSRLRRAGM